MFAQHQDIRRRLDGSIDIDFYRQNGLTERRSVMTDLFKGVGRAGKGLISVAIIIAAVYMAPRDAADWNSATAARGAGMTSASLVNPASATR